MAQKFKNIMLKISGEVLAGKSEFGIDHKLVHKLAEEIAPAIHTHKINLAMVIGGGNFWRYKDSQESGIDRVKSDHMGMLATIMNAIAMNEAFHKIGLESEIFSAIKIKSVTEEFEILKARKHFKSGKITICAGGTGSPFFTTDSAAALRALELQCDLLLKATKVDGIYDKDPMKYADAKRFDQISFQEVLEKKLQVMDLTAISLCQEKPLPIMIFNLNIPGELEKAFSGEQCGSLIS
jgi:uridylate kinase